MYVCMCTHTLHFTFAYSKQLSINEYAVLFGCIKNANELNQFVAVLFTRQCSLLPCNDNFMTIHCVLHVLCFLF